MNSTYLYAFIGAFVSLITGIFLKLRWFKKANEKYKLEKVRTDLSGVEKNNKSLTAIELVERANKYRESRRKDQAS